MVKQKTKPIEIPRRYRLDDVYDEVMCISLLEKQGVLKPANRWNLYE